MRKEWLTKPEPKNIYLHCTCKLEGNSLIKDLRGQRKYMGWMNSIHLSVYVWICTDSVNWWKHSKFNSCSEILKHGKENPGRLLCLNNQSGNRGEINFKSTYMARLLCVKNISRISLLDKLNCTLCFSLSKCLNIFRIFLIYVLNTINKRKKTCSYRNIC